MTEQIQRKAEDYPVIVRSVLRCIDIVVDWLRHLDSVEILILSVAGGIILWLLYLRMRSKW